MKKTAALLPLLLTALCLHGQAIINLSPLSIIFQNHSYHDREWDFDWCRYEFKNVSGDTVYVHLPATLHIMNASSSGIPPGQSFMIDWYGERPSKNTPQKINVPFESRGRHFNITLSRAVDTGSKPLLLAMDSSVFDRGHVPYSQQTGRTVCWKVRNISDMEVLCPTDIDVWGDCNITDRFAKRAPLPAGQARGINLYVHFPATGIRKQKEGEIKVTGDKGGKRFVQTMRVSVAACFDPPPAADNLRR